MPSLPARLLASALRLGVRAISVSDQPGFTGKDGEASYVDAPRLVCGVSGRSRYRVRDRNGLGIVTLGPGGVLALAAGCWVTALPRRGSSTIGAVIHPKLLRLIARVANERTVVEVPSKEGSLHELASRLVHPWPGPEPQVAVGAMATLVLAECALLAQEAKEPTPNQEAWLAACAIIEDSCMRHLTRSEVASSVRVHPNHLARLFRRHGGCSFAQALRRARLTRAAGLLDDPHLKLDAVARLSGFSSASHLVRCWRLAHGCTPRRRQVGGSILGRLDH